jgi:hypothetical protein
VECIHHLYRTVARSSVGSGNAVESGGIAQRNESVMIWQRHQNYEKTHSERMRCMMVLHDNPKIS